MFQANNDLRESARKHGVPFWLIADTMGVSEPTMTRKLRRELPAEEKAKIFDIIENLSKRKEGI